MGLKSIKRDFIKTNVNCTNNCSTGIEMQAIMNDKLSISQQYDGAI